MSALSGSNCRRRDDGSDGGPAVHTEEISMIDASLTRLTAPYAALRVGTRLGSLSAWGRRLVKAALWKVFVAGAYLFGTDTEAAEQCARDWDRRVNGRRVDLPIVSRVGGSSVACAREPSVRPSMGGCGGEDRNDSRGWRQQ